FNLFQSPREPLHLPSFPTRTLFRSRKAPFLPLIPGVKFIDFNDESQLKQITEKTAAVILESIQGGAGFIQPKNDYFKKVRQRCRSEEHTSELQSRENLVCRLLLEKK